MNINTEELFDIDSGVPTSAQDFPILVKLNGDTSGQPREKMSADGRPTYKVDAQVITTNREGEMITARNVFIHSIEPLTAKGGLLTVQLFKAQGRVWVKPFVNNERVAYSVCVEKLVPVQASEQKATEQK